MISSTLKEVAKGLMTFVVPASVLRPLTDGTTTARYCYSVFLRHLVMIKRCGGVTRPIRVAEIGPGGSIGVGLAALLAGAERYDGFDVTAYNFTERTRAVFEELLALFRVRAPIPDNTELPYVRPWLECYSFPDDILDQARLTRTLAPQRIERIRRDLLDPTREGSMVGYVAPWRGSTEIEKGTVDWIYSQAVMEHVDALSETYKACFSWMSPGGTMTHEIDLRSHGMASDWNGHWAWSEPTWRAIRGARPWLLNRAPCSSHIALIEQAGFVITGMQTATSTDGIGRQKLSRRFRSLPHNDLITTNVFVAATKPN